MHVICTAFRLLVFKRKWWFACICAWNMHTYIDNLDFFKFSVPYIDILFLFICTKTLIFLDIWRKFYCAYTVHIPCVVHGTSLKLLLAWYMSDSFVYLNSYSYISNIETWEWNFVHENGPFVHKKWPKFFTISPKIFTCLLCINANWLIFNCYDFATIFLDFMQPFLVFWTIEMMK